MVQIRPLRGGFLRPFGCAWFIREFLLGHGPEGTPKIDPEKGACQADIFYHYKLALHRAYAENATARENEDRVKAGVEPYTGLQYQERVDWHLRRIPYKLVKSRYHSFRRYFHYLKQLGWVEQSGIEETSAVQEATGGHPTSQPRKLYRLTGKGIEAPDEDWSNPQSLIYPKIADVPFKEYIAKRREGKRYRRKKRDERFLRPFTAGMFIREYLMGLGPEDSPRIDPDEGDYAERIFYYYKEALRRAYARDAVARENEERIRNGKEPYTDQEYQERLEWHLDRIPYKLHRARSISFFRYFHYLKQLGFVEPTGKAEESYIQGLDYESAPPCRYYRLTSKGKEAPDYEWYRPQLTLYPQLTQYFAQKNIERKKRAGKQN